MDDRPLVSAILPTHNRARCLPRALDSVFAQEGLGARFDLDVVLVDDASSDATPQVIGRYPRVRYIRLPEKRGAAAAYNAGLLASRGGYVSFLDDDDEWLPHKLRAQVPLLEARRDVGVVYGQSIVRFEGHKYLRPETTEAPSCRVFLAMLRNNFCGHHACLLARREVFDRAGPFDESFGSYEDYDMSLRLAFSFPFHVRTGAVDVYNLSPRGLWLTRAATGAGTDDAVRVIEKALQMLPDSAAYVAVKREVRACAALYGVAPLIHLGELSRAWEQLLAVLRSHPQIAREAWVRNLVTAVASRRALAAASPLAAAHVQCAEVAGAMRGGGMERWRARRTVAGVWAEIARSLPSAPRANRREAASAIACALAHAPSSLFSKTLLRVIVRCLLGRRAEAWGMGAYAWLQRSRSMFLGIRPS